jgi:hypothetical protein
MRYARVDLWIGIALVVLGAVAMMAFTAATFAGHAEFGQFSDAGATAAGLEKYAGRLPAVLFAVALIDACIIGASAVSLATAYALGDLLSLRHSLHRKPTDAKSFYAVYCGLIALSAALVLTPGTPLGLLTNAVQTLAGVLLPSATVFLLLLCNDKAVLGPWTNTRGLNLFTGAIVAVLVMLSVILTASVLYPGITGTQMATVLAGGSMLALVIASAVKLYERRHGTDEPETAIAEAQRDTWRMPPLGALAPAPLTMLSRVWLIALRGYLVLAAGLVLVRIIQLATSGV